MVEEGKLPTLWTRWLSWPGEGTRETEREKEREREREREREDRKSVV